ncbi:GtrA family protein [Prochlorococcus marinus XMU1406]|nr:GtrA family protein [Prochlorococcus marinus]MBO8207228.1 GtrA family protein [Prochlorococcus marinus XMU1406]MCR8543043.1 GtrA family protein [Prochlorococcus marinus XMU1427]
MYKFIKTNNFQIIKFVITGFLASILNFIIFSLLYFVYKNIVFASFLGYSAGILISFIFAKIWVFSSASKQPLIKSFSIFCLIYFLGAIEMSFVIYLVNLITKNYKIAWFFGAFVASLNNFLGSKYFSFRN